MRAALQIEPEHDVALRPGRPMPDHALRKEIGQGEQAYGESQEQNCRRLPAREKKHGLGFPYFAAPLTSRVPASCAIQSPDRSSGLVVLYRLAFRAHVATHGPPRSPPHAPG